MHIGWFDSYDPDHALEVGGKNASLGTLTLAELPVPPGFAVMASAYRKVLADSGVDAAIHDLVAHLDPRDSHAVKAAGAQARALVTLAAMPDWLTTEIADAYAELSRRCGTAEVPVAVRSSATCEDQPDASFAGEHDTYLWIRGADAVVEHVQRCWASLFTDRAICYRREMGYVELGAAMSVGVQKMVLPRASGVAFTLNPSNGDRSQVAIECSWGLGEAVVAGEVTPDNFLVDKVLGEVTQRRISDKAVQHRVSAGGVLEAVEVEESRRRVPCVTDAELRQVAALAKRAERHYGCPQDVEWALDEHLPPGQDVLLLQSRPETVWSRRPQGNAYATTGAITSYMNLLPAASAGPR
jgi:pyruvate,water dikinase